MSVFTIDIDSFLLEVQAKGEPFYRQRKFYDFIMEFIPQDREIAIKYLKVLIFDVDFMEHVWKVMNLYTYTLKQAKKRMLVRIVFVMAQWDVLPYELGITDDPTNIGFWVPWDDFSKYSFERSQGNRCIRYRAIQMKGYVYRMFDYNGPCFLDNYRVRDSRELDEDYWRYEHPSPFRQDRPPEMSIYDYEDLDWSSDREQFEIDDDEVILTVEVGDQPEVDEYEEIEINDLPPQGLLEDNMLDVSGMYFRVEETLLLHDWSKNTASSVVGDEFRKHVADLVVQGRNALVLNLGKYEQTSGVDWFLIWNDVEDYVRQNYKAWSHPYHLERHEVTGRGYLQWMYSTYILALIHSGHDPLIEKHLTLTFYASIYAFFDDKAVFDERPWKLCQKDSYSWLEFTWDGFDKRFFLTTSFDPDGRKAMVGYYLTKCLEGFHNYRLWFKEPVCVFPQLRMWDIVELYSLIQLRRKRLLGVIESRSEWVEFAPLVISALKSTYGTLGLTEKEAFIAFLHRKHLKVKYDFNGGDFEPSYFWETRRRVS